MLEELGFWDKTRSTLSDCGSSGTRQGDRFGGEGVGGEALRAALDLAIGS
jgi:RimJ/RimL family protein N-acetyltransferase